VPLRNSSSNLSYQQDLCAGTAALSQQQFCISNDISNVFWNFHVIPLGVAYIIMSLLFHAKYQLTLRFTSFPRNNRRNSLPTIKTISHTLKYFVKTLFFLHTRDKTQYKKYLKSYSSGKKYLKKYINIVKFFFYDIIVRYLNLYNCAFRHVNF